MHVYRVQRLWCTVERCNGRARPSNDEMCVGGQTFNHRPLPRHGVYKIVRFDACGRKDGDMDTRWMCGPLVPRVGSSTRTCEVGISLNHYRYVRQIQIGESPHSACKSGLICVW